MGGADVPAHGRRPLVREPVGEPLVVAAVDALVEEPRLQVPVGLGQEEEVGVGRLHAPYDLHPVGLRPRRAEAVAPGGRAEKSLLVCPAINRSAR